MLKMKSLIFAMLIFIALKLSICAPEDDLTIILESISSGEDEPEPQEGKFEQQYKADDFTRWLSTDENGISRCSYKNSTLKGPNHPCNEPATKKY